MKTWLAPALAGTIAGATFIALPAIGVALIDDRAPAPAPTTTTTTEAPYCVGTSLVIVGTGVVEYAPGCDVPVVHDPPGTGPTTGPNGERHEGAALDGDGP